MKRLVITFALVVAILGAVVATGNAQTVLTGNTDGGAFFKIVVPAVWNGDLVIWNHGYSFNPIGPVSDLGPLNALQLSEGYAVAASSYQQNNWAVFKTKNDLQNMVNVFKANFGTPNHVLVNGASLGGIVTAQAIEKANIGNVVGAFPFCGAVAGSRNWDGGIDLRLLYDVVCGGVPGGAIPGGPEGLPVGFPPFPAGVGAILTAVNTCTGASTPAAFRTPAQAARLAQLLGISQVPNTSFLNQDMIFVTYGLSDLIHNPNKLGNSNDSCTGAGTPTACCTGLGTGTCWQGVGNANVNYDGGGFFDTNIQRVTPNAGAANRVEKNYTPSGNVGGVKIVSIHTDKDGLVVVENEDSYRDVVSAGNLSTAIAIEATPSHCGFTSSEVAAGWESLRAWVGGGPQPTATDIQNTCLFISGFNPTQCRINPAYVIPNIDNRILPR